MKKIISFILSFALLFTSIPSIAAIGDYIHVGAEKGYSIQSDADKKELLNDLKTLDIKKFYRQVTEDGEFINIVDEQIKEQEALLTLLREKNIDLSNPQAIEDFLLDDKNENSINIAINDSKIGLTKEFNDIKEGTKDINEYFDGVYADKLKEGVNYSKPSRGYVENSTKLINPVFPSGSNATSWMIATGDKEFGPFRKDSVLNISNARKYSFGTDIIMPANERHLLLVAVGSGNTVKAYASINISEDMIHPPKQLVYRDEGIGINLTKGTDYSGSTKVTVSQTGDWNLAVLDNEPGTIYTSSTFNSTKYVEGMEIIVAKDEELNKLDELNKYILAYTVVDGKIDKYNYINVQKENTSGLIDALSLLEKSGDDNYNYTKPAKGQNAGTIVIADLMGLEELKADKWMYKIIDATSATVPKRDTKVGLSLDCEAGKDIEISLGDKLLLMATDKDGRVRAARLIAIDAEQIKNPLAEELKLTTDYNLPVKGSKIGHTIFTFIKMDRADKWVYVLSDGIISKPELDTEVAGGTPIIFETGKNSTEDIGIETDVAKLKSNDFKKYMMVYGIGNDNKIKVFKQFTINYENILMPNADKLISPGHYSKPEKGSSPNTTRIAALKLPDGLSSGYKFRYKLVDRDSIDNIEFNTIINGANNLTTTTIMGTEVGKDLLIMVTDSDNRTKYYDVVKLEFEHVLAGAATPLQPTTNYKGPVPGVGNGTTRFTFLKSLSSSQEMYYTFVNKDFKVIESGTVIEIGTGAGQYTVAKENVDISAAIGDNLLLVSVDKVSKKVVGAISFNLGEEHIKGGAADKLIYGNYEFILGDNPSTTKLKLVPTGLENSRNIVWRYELVDVEETDTNKLPYFNQVVNLPIYASQNGRDDAVIGRDIPVNKVGIDYGWILILATDSGGKVKAYDYVKIDSSKVKEHAPIIGKSGGGDLEYNNGSTVDTIRFIDLPALDTDHSYKYLISDREQSIPALGSTLPSGVKDYISGSDIPVHIGKHLTLYKVDKDNKIVAYKKFVVDKVMQGKATLPSDIFLEGDIKNGGQSFTIKLTNAKWADDLVNNKTKRDALFNGFKADKEGTEWNKVVSSMITDGAGAILRNSDTEVTILLPRTPAYDISEELKISLIVSPEAIDGALNPIVADGVITIKPTIDATISGDVVKTIVRESDIKLGGKTIIITLKDGTWAADVTGIIDGFSGGINWNLIKSAFGTDEAARKKYITRNDGKMVTIVLPSVSGVTFGTTSEVISLTIPKTLVSGAENPIVASPNFTLYPDIVKVEGKVHDGKDTIKVLPPDYRIVDKDNDTWKVKVTTGTLITPVDVKNLEFVGLPKGLIPVVSLEGTDIITIKLTGTASSKIDNDIDVKLKIKGTAISEPNSTTSDEIVLKIEKEKPMSELDTVGIDVAGKKLTNTNASMDYSLDSTNGIDGKWYSASSGTETEITDGFIPGKVYIKNKNNLNEFRLVATLAYPKAPTGISVGEVDYKTNPGKVSVKLTGLSDSTDISYEYTKNGGTKWVNMTNKSAFIDLESDSDLRFKISATKDSLESLPTAKLNGLDLSKVTMNVGAGLIQNTNTTIQYSTNSNDGIDGKWTTAKATETPNVDFVSGNDVWIRQQTSKVNIRKLGTISSMSEPNSSDVSYDISKKEIKNNISAILEYKITGSNWTKLDANATLSDIIFAAGPLEIRTKGNDTHLPSKAVTIETIPNPVDPPELKSDDDKKTIQYKDGSTFKPMDKNFEYRVGANSTLWKSGEGFNTDSEKNDTVVIYVRKKAGEKTLPSNEKAISFTKNLTFENIVFDIANKQILGTTQNMEYSINSINEKSGIWQTASSGKTTIEPFEGMYIWLREKNKPSTENLWINNLGRLAKPKLNSVYYNISTSKISNQTGQNLQYRIGDDPWKDIDANTDIYGVEFKPGKFEFRQKSTTTMLESHSEQKVIISAKASGPNVNIDDVENVIVSIAIFDTNRSKLEYSINNSPWIVGDLLENEDLNGNKEVRIRIKATPTVLESQITTVNFTKNLDLNHIKLSTHVQPLELNGTTTQMEYMINDSGKWFECGNINTKLKRLDGSDLNDESLIQNIKIRDKKQPANFIEIKK